MKSFPSSRALLAALVTGLAFAPLLPAADGNSTRSYKWVDKNGVTHYGDMVPPEYSGQGHSELNNQGVELRSFPRQMTSEEAAVAQKKAADESRQRQHDAFLLNTYTKVSDIEELRDERVALIDGQMNIVRGSIDVNRQRLDELSKRMRSFQPYSTSANARRIPDQLAEEVVRTIKERDSLRDSLASREAEKAGLRAQFDADVARYRQLTTRPAVR